MKKTKFNPFADPNLSQGSRSWLQATALQALVTCVLLGLAKLSEGRLWQSETQVLVMLGIAATWSLALRTIRERLVELMQHWQKASRGLLRKASESGRHFIATPLSASQERHIKDTIMQLRWIAVGLTIPFFVMPMTCSFVSIFLSIRFGTASYWAPFAVFTMLSALIVAGYFHWAIVPTPAPVRSNDRRRPFTQRARRR